MVDDTPAADAARESEIAERERAYDLRMAKIEAILGARP